jgi:polysaccharide export outer membrane protein
MKTHSAYALFCSVLVTLGASLNGAPASTGSKNAAAAQPAVQSGSSTIALGSNDLPLQPDDVLRVLVFGEEDINKQGEVRVSKDGAINLPLVQVINLKGKTARQAEEIIRARYDKDFLVNPQVQVTVLKAAERFVNVTGAVNTPGRLPLPQDGLTIVDAISAAGGPSRLANLQKVVLTRRNADGDLEKKEINVEEMMKQGSRDVQPLQLEKDDTILVKERII